jgi:hypothetical protein
MSPVQRARGALAILVMFSLGGTALAQPEPTPPPGGDPAEPPGQPDAPPQPEPPQPPDVATTPGTPDDGVAPSDASEELIGTLRLHIISTRNTYVPMGFDIFSVESQAVVAFGKGADETTGQPAPSWDLPSGLYKIVRSGEPYESLMDFATVQIFAGEVLDYVIVVDPDTMQFRGAGPVTGELPTGTTIAGIRIALSAGGSVSLTQRENVVGGTSGVSALVGLFGNFSLVFDRDNHFLSVTSDLAVTLNDPAVASIASTQDRWEAAALYAYNIGNPYVGPYGRASFSTRLFPGFLYFEEGQDDTVTVQVVDTDGDVTTKIYGEEANQDDLRIKLAKPFAPITLQEEVGANLKAVSLDLLLLKLTVATRLGFGFRQGIMNGLLVRTADVEEPTRTVVLTEVDDYATLGPVVGAGATVTFARWLFGAAQASAMVPLKDKDDAGDDFGERLLWDFSGTAGLKLPALTSFLFASLDYTFRLQKDGFVEDDTQFDQTLMARLNVSLF